MSTYKITPAKAQAFFRRFHYWMKYWGIEKCWEISEDIEPSEEFNAACRLGEGDAAVAIVIATEWDRQPTVEEIDYVAFHESLHLLLAPLNPTLENIGSEHRIIRTFEKMVYPYL